MRICAAPQGGTAAVEPGSGGPRRKVEDGLPGAVTCMSESAKKGIWERENTALRDVKRLSERVHGAKEPFKGWQASRETERPESKN